MSHVYLTKKKHQSHIEKTYEEVYDPIVKRFPKKWQSKIIRVAMYYPGEVFAEDLTFKVLEGSKTTWAKVTLEYFRLKRATQKSLAISSKRKMWENDLIHVRNCYYASELHRRYNPDITGDMSRYDEAI